MVSRQKKGILSLDTLKYNMLFPFPHGNEKGYKAKKQWSYGGIEIGARTCRNRETWNNRVPIGPLQEIALLGAFWKTIRCPRTRTSAEECRTFLILPSCFQPQVRVAGNMSGIKVQGMALHAHPDPHEASCQSLLRNPTSPNVSILCFPGCLIKPEDFLIKIMFFQISFACS